MQVNDISLSTTGRKFLRPKLDLKEIGFSLVGMDLTAKSK